MLFNTFMGGVLIASTVTPVNLTLIISVISVSCAVMVALINIFGSKKKIKDEELRQSEYIKDLERKISESKSKIEDLKDIVSSSRTEIEKLKVEAEHTTKSVTELRADNRELVQRLDDLLKQILDWVNG